MTDSSAPKTSPRGFGFELHSRVLADTLAGSVKKDQKPLVAGIFGEWGSGKTTLLEAIRDRIRETTKNDTDVTLPVLFNPWRYESEEHLIVPLLKTTQYALADAMKQAGEEDLQRYKFLRRVFKNDAYRKREWFEVSSQGLKDAAIAVSAGLGRKFDLLGLEGELKGKDFQDQPDKASLEKYESLYYKLTEQLEKLTRPASDGRKLNLIYLIDDLDRCMPEKAVQMLESIKLFLDVKGCAFALALDEEVVDRGIEYHYKAYRDAHSTHNDSIAYALEPDRFAEFSKARLSHHASPITGSEYLEKIIHLPFHLPVLEKHDVRAFLLDEYPELFAVENPATVSPQDPGTARQDEQQRETWKKDILDLFLTAVPYVPRKLKRAANLLALFREHFKERGCREFDNLSLARVVLLQLFAPKIYTLSREWPEVILTLHQWAKLRKPQEEGRAPLTWKDDEYFYEILDDTNHHRAIWQRRLCELLKESLKNRSAFDIRDMFPPGDDHLPPEIINRRLDQYQLCLTLQPPPQGASASISMPMATVSGTMEITLPTLQATITASQTDLPETGKVENINDFLDALFSGDMVQVIGALRRQSENLQGQALHSSVFDPLLHRARQSLQQDIIDAPWLEAVSPHLSLGQYKTLLADTGLLNHLAGKL